MSDNIKARIVAFLLVAAVTYPVSAAVTSSEAPHEAVATTPVGEVPSETNASQESIQSVGMDDVEDWVEPTLTEETLEEVRFPSEGNDGVDPKPVDLDDTTMGEEEQVLVAQEAIEESRPWYLRAVDFVASHISEGKARAKVEFEKRRVDMKYGEGSSADPSFTTIVNAEAELQAAAELRQQKELALEVERQNKLKLYNESLMCLALNGYYEARGETADQEVAAGAVVLNRLSVGFRDATTICEVVHSPKQFSWVETHGTAIPDFENSAERKAWERSVLIAKRLLDLDATYIDPTNGAVYYYNPSIVKWKYAPYYIETAVLGSHRFMREKKGHQYYIDNSRIRLNPALFNGLSHEEREALKKEHQNNR